MFAAIRRELQAWLEAALRGFPGNAGRKLRRAIYPGWMANKPSQLGVSDGVWFNGWRNIVLGSNVSFGRACSLEASTGPILIGSNCSFNHGVWLGADHGRITIGSNVIVGPYVVMRAANHKFDRLGELPISHQGHDNGEIVIGEDVWIGAHVTLVSGARIGSHSVIAAGAVVRGEIPSGSLAGGVPAKVIRRVFDKTEAVVFAADVGE